jgi:hypothetical protein
MEDRKYKVVKGSSAIKRKVMSKDESAANINLIDEKKYIIDEVDSSDILEIEEEEILEEQDVEVEYKFSQKLSNLELESMYMGLLLNNPEYMVRYHFLYKNCHFESDELDNIYRSVVFTEGERYTPEIAKQGYTYATVTESTYGLKKGLKRKVEGKQYNMEKVFTELQKLFVLRKHYQTTPIKEIQDKVSEILDYVLYDKMSIDEVEEAVAQVIHTSKFKRGVLNKGLTEFLKAEDNSLTNGLEFPFPILSRTIKGLRINETMSFAMPSNAGKSRFSIFLTTYIALIHKKKVLIVSNEMVEEKMKLCLLTTIINNKNIQKIHGVEVSKTEGELLEFQFRPDDPTKVETDGNGYILQRKNEKKKDFAKRLLEVSTEFKKVTTITEWANKQISNSIYFVNITDHTNDELKTIIMNYYYKEKIQYIFYDTLKTDIDNIGNGDELKKTATILSNLAQDFGMHIFSTMQLSEGATLPVNLSVVDLAVSRTVKEVLDTLALLKQIHRDTLGNYEYSMKEVDTVFYELEKSDDPDVRYYACVIDKNRAGAKPTLLLRLNLAYNMWEEIGYLRLKQNNQI